MVRQSRSAFPAYGKNFYYRFRGWSRANGRTTSVEQGHSPVLHARNEQRGREAMTAVPGAETVVIGDLSSVAQMKEVAAKVNALGHFDAVIHNAGVGYQSPRRVATEDGLPLKFAVNTLAPYVLTALIQRPKRLVYLSSGLQQNGDPSLEDLAWERRQWRGTQAYSDTKLHDVMIAFAIARRWPDAFSNALEPGWVATKMGGAHAPDNLDEGHRTQVCSRLALTLPPKLRDSIFITGSCASRIPRREMRASRTNSLPPARISLV